MGLSKRLEWLESISEGIRSARPPEPSEAESEEALFVRDFTDRDRARKRLLRIAGREAGPEAELHSAWNVRARLAG